MQSTRSPLSVQEIETLKHLIEEKFFTPFITRLKKYKRKDQEKFIRVLVFCLQCKKRPFADKLFQGVKFLENFEGASIEENFSEFKKILCQNENLKEEFQRLADLYLKGDAYLLKLTSMFPALGSQLLKLDAAAIQTCIRELFYDYLNPLTFTRINPPTISLTPSKVNNGPHLFNLPPEIHCKIYSHLDYMSLFLFKQTCKSAYLSYSNIHRKENNIFYLIACQEKNNKEKDRITESFYVRGDPSNKLKNMIYEEEMISSLLSADHIKIFYSLYHALEYANDQYHFLNLNWGIREIPAIWVGRYIGDPADLQFFGEKLVLNQGMASLKKYNINQRETLVSYAKTSIQSIQPLVGRKLIPLPDFADYEKTQPVVYFMEYLRGSEPVVASHKKNKCPIQ